MFNERNRCCGCTACEAICAVGAISLEPDTEGFLYPTIQPGKCVNCRQCEDVCHFQSPADQGEYIVPEVFAVKHTSSSVRRESSSGGVFTALSDYVLALGGVIYGAGFDEHLCVVHQRAESHFERDKLRGSKYVQSSQRGVFAKVAEDLLAERVVLYTGTPCQVAGLTGYLSHIKGKRDRLITVDMICHGVPSPLLFKDYLAYLQKINRSRVKGYFFRSKVGGWGHVEGALFEDGRLDYSSDLSQTFRTLFHAGICMRPACHVCKYANARRYADLTMADYWGIQDIMPDFYDQLGVSAVLVNSMAGKHIFSAIQPELDVRPSSLVQCAARQTNLSAPTAAHPLRSDFWRDYHRYGLGFVIRRYANYSVLARTKRRLIEALDSLGMLQRAIGMYHWITAKLRNGVFSTRKRY